MDISLHYLTMANQMLIQKRLLERVKASGLTLGQPKVLDYLKIMMEPVRRKSQRVVLLRQGL